MTDPETRVRSNSAPIPYTCITNTTDTYINHHMVSTIDHLRPLPATVYEAIEQLETSSGVAIAPPLSFFPFFPSTKRLGNCAPLLFSPILFQRHEVPPK